MSSLHIWMSHKLSHLLIIRSLIPRFVWSCVSKSLVRLTFIQFLHFCGNLVISSCKVCAYLLHTPMPYKFGYTHTSERSKGHGLVINAIMLKPASQEKSQAVYANTCLHACIPCARVYVSCRYLSPGVHAPCRYECIPATTRLFVINSGLENLLCTTWSLSTTNRTRAFYLTHTLNHPARSVAHPASIPVRKSLTRVHEQSHYHV